MKIFARILAPLTLFEWGGILTYFYFSGRIAAFLHPMFRPLVLVTGVLLIITALCVAIFHEEECAHDHDHEHGREHEKEREHDDDGLQHGHYHNRLSLGGFLAFLILLLPLALAAKISPDSYGANLIKNRGLVEDIRSIPGAASSYANRTRPVEATSAPTMPAEDPSLTVTAASTPASTPKYVGVPEKTGGAQQGADSEPPLPSNDYEQPIPAQSTPALPNVAVHQPDSSGRIKAEVVDLLFAAQEPSTRKDFEGKNVELTGQLVANKSKTGAKSKTATGSFKLLRLVMVCCAADAMPVAVKIETHLPAMEIREMQWLKVTGRVHFQARAKDDESDGVDYGDYPEPVVVADSIKKTEPPLEKYLY
jgi:uncharacterized repeat protein (TIGR03943 family)